MTRFPRSWQTSRRRFRSFFWSFVILSITPSITVNFLSSHGDCSVSNLVPQLPWQHSSWLSINYSTHPEGASSGDGGPHADHMCGVWTLLLEGGRRGCVTNSPPVSFKENSHQTQRHLTPKCAAAYSNSKNNNNGKRIEKSERRHQERAEEKLDLRLVVLLVDPSWFQFIGWITTWG